MYVRITARNLRVWPIITALIAAGKPQTSSKTWTEALSSTRIIHSSKNRSRWIINWRGSRKSRGLGEVGSRVMNACRNLTAAAKWCIAPQTYSSLLTYMYFPFENVIYYMLGGWGYLGLCRSSCVRSMYVEKVGSIMPFLSNFKLFLTKHTNPF